MTDTALLTDDDLLRRMLAGDEHAFAALYRRRQGGIYGFARQMTGNNSAAEEITQEVFLTLIREARQFDPAKGSLKAFLYGIGRNYALRYIERESPYVSLAEMMPERDSFESAAWEPVSQEDLVADLAQNEVVERVRHAVLALPPNYREVVILCDLQEMGYSEAAGIIGCAMGTIRSRLHRARSLLLMKLKSGQKAILNARVKAVSGG